MGTSRDISIPDHVVAQVSPCGVRRIGLVVGIDQYQDARIDNLGAAVADARAMHELMVDRACGLFDPGHTTLLIDAEAGERRLKNELERLAKEAMPDDEVWIYFAGHGIVHDGEHRLVPADAEQEFIDSTSVAFPAFARKIRCRRKIIFLDCCHAGATEQSTRRIHTAEELLRSYDGTGTITFCSSDSKERSVELKEFGRGAFSYWLERGLRGEADRDGDGVVTSSELWEFVRRNVERDALRMSGVRQTPRIKLDTRGTFALSLNPQAIALRARSEANPSPTSQDPLDHQPVVADARPAHLGETLHETPSHSTADGAATVANPPLEGSPSEGSEPDLNARERELAGEAAREAIPIGPEVETLPWSTARFSAQVLYALGVIGAAAACWMYEELIHPARSALYAILAAAVVFGTSFVNSGARGWPWRHRLAESCAVVGAIVGNLALGRYLYAANVWPVVVAGILAVLACIRTTPSSQELRFRGSINFFLASIALGSIVTASGTGLVWSAMRFPNREAEATLAEAKRLLQGSDPESARRAIQLLSRVAWAPDMAVETRFIAEAQYLLGDCSYYGRGIERDPTQAADWYARAALQGHAMAQNDLGYCFDEGIGVDENDSKAVEWYTRSALQGNARAQYNLGLCLRRGEGVEQDSRMAEMWLRKAADQGHQEAAAELSGQ